MTQRRRRLGLLGLNLYAAALVELSRRQLRQKQNKNKYCYEDADKNAKGWTHLKTHDGACLFYQRGVRQNKANSKQEWADSERMGSYAGSQRG